MLGYWLFICLVVLGLNVGSGNLAWSQDSQSGQDEGNSFQVSDKNREDSLSKDQYQSFSPVKPSDERNFPDTRPRWQNRLRLPEVFNSPGPN